MGSESKSLMVIEPLPIWNDLPGGSSSTVSMMAPAGLRTSSRSFGSTCVCAPGKFIMRSCWMI